MTIKREPQRRKPSTLNFGMLEDLLAVPAASKAQERSSTILSMVRDFKWPCKQIWHHKWQNVFQNILFSLGIVLVHDLTNKKSSQNLYRWSLEALNKDSSPTGVIVSNGYVLFCFTAQQIHVSNFYFVMSHLRVHLFFFFWWSEYDREQFIENPVPLLLIGTKLDQIPESKRNEVLTRTAFLSEDFNAEEINLVGVFCASFHHNGPHS